VARRVLQTKADKVRNGEHYVKGNLMILRITEYTSVYTTRRLWLLVYVSWSNETRNVYCLWYRILSERGNKEGKLHTCNL